MTEQNNVTLDILTKIKNYKGVLEASLNRITNSLKVFTSRKDLHTIRKFYDRIFIEAETNDNKMQEDRNNLHESIQNIELCKQLLDEIETVNNEIKKFMNNSKISTLQTNAYDTILKHDIFPNNTAEEEVFNQNSSRGGKTKRKNRKHTGSKKKTIYRNKTKK